MVFALLEGEARELRHDTGATCELLPLEGEHGCVLVQGGKRRPVGIEDGVVVLYEGTSHLIRIHC